jgi:hypothetical protein
MGSVLLEEEIADIAGLADTALSGVDSTVCPDDDELNIHQSNTARTHKSAVKFYNRFVDEHNAGKPPEDRIKHFSQLTQDDVCGVVLENKSLANPNDPPVRSIMSKFAKWGLNAKHGSDNNKKNYQPDVIVQYFNSFKVQLFKKFKPLGFAGSLPDWYDELNRALNLRASVECIRRGGKVSKKAVGFARKALAEACLILLKQDNFALGTEERAIILAIYYAVGRGGEVSI